MGGFHVVYRWWSVQWNSLRQIPSLTGNVTFSPNRMSKKWLGVSLMQWISIFHPNLHVELEQAAISITIFAMFAVCNTSDLDPEQDGVRRPILVLATNRAKCPFIVPCLPYKHASYSPKNRWEGTHLHEYVLYFGVRGLHGLFQFCGGLAPTCILWICRKPCIVNVRVIIRHNFHCIPLWGT